MPDGPIYVDTNIFIAMLEHSDERSQLLYELFRIKSRSASPHLATSELTLAELLVHPFRNGNTKRVEAYERTISSNGLLTVRRIERPVLRKAAQLRAFDGGLRLPDAIHLATAILVQSAVILTGDIKLLRWSSPSMDDSEPFGAKRFLAPEIPVIRALIAELAS